MDPIFQSEVPVYFGSLMQIIDDFDEVLQPNMRAVIFKVLATVFNIYEEPDDRIKNVKRLYKWCVQQRLFSFTQGVQDQWNDFIDAIGQLYIVLCQTYRKRPSSKFMKRFPEQDWHERDLRNTPIRRRF